MERGILMEQKLTRDELYLWTCDLITGKAIYSHVAIKLSEVLDIVETLLTYENTPTEEEIMTEIGKVLLTSGHVYNSVEEVWVCPDGEPVTDKQLLEHYIFGEEHETVFKVELKTETKDDNGYVLTLTYGDEQETCILGTSYRAKYNAHLLFDALSRCATTIWEFTGKNVEQFNLQFGQESYHQTLAFYSKDYAPLNEEIANDDAQQTFSFLLKWDALVSGNKDRLFIN